MAFGGSPARAGQGVEGRKVLRRAVTKEESSGAVSSCLTEIRQGILDLLHWAAGKRLTC